MLAILSAITEFIKENNGTQSSTEFYAGLVSEISLFFSFLSSHSKIKLFLDDFFQMKTLEAPSKDENEIIATLSLLTMVIKSVPQPVLRKSFPEAGDKLLQLVEQFAESDNQNVLRSVSKTVYLCLSILLFDPKIQMK